MPPQKPLTNLPPANPDCPCGSQKNLRECCLPFIEGQRTAPTAEALMRSRYTAHTLLAIDYLWATWSPEQRLRSSPDAIHQWAASCEWLGLRIIRTQGGQPQDTQGTVEFMALFKQAGELHQHHEISLFKQALGRWLYIDHQAP